MDPFSDPSRPAVDAAPTAPDPPTSVTEAIATPATIATTAHLARFEFSDQGTKVLMVEWHPAVAAAPDLDAAPAPASAQTSTPVPASALGPAAWQVSWSGKSATTIIPARDADEDEAGPRRRVYFLLPPEAPIPPAVTIARSGRTSLTVKPLPAIFPPGFDADAGARGVLHTLWATRRLSELQHEIDAELRANAESVGLEMVLAEKQWILDNFLRARPLPGSPQFSSPAHRRLGDRFKGLRLATSPAELVVAGSTADAFTMTNLPSAGSSYQGGDVAISSFLDMSRRDQHHGSVPAKTSTQDGEDDLFALPLSPRSPDMKKSPFSAL
ncbi:hypothetical protein HRG_011431 [Hirsutella rhossiliensis]|uniref:Uncharacterized protein n=1 Tax=Hirsutella rhossiliensis TaxID=111463 RepID=A0A9P8MMT9_9HYPO|nr:uncharacterized protein HRG_11431 [Hirsutella rhossiliensis]KAH0957284.1 hypothetical protein HRG_11431 [Hirsutella rhossiliensis]